MFSPQIRLLSWIAYCCLGCIEVLGWSDGAITSRDHLAVRLRDDGVDPHLGASSRRSTALIPLTLHPLHAVAHSDPLPSLPRLPLPRRHDPIPLLPRSQPLPRPRHRSQRLRTTTRSRHHRLALDSRCSIVVGFLGGRKRCATQWCWVRDAYSYAWGGSGRGEDWE